MFPQLKGRRCLTSIARRWRAARSKYDAASEIRSLRRRAPRWHQRSGDAPAALSQPATAAGWRDSDTCVRVECFRSLEPNSARTVYAPSIAVHLVRCRNFDASALKQRAADVGPPRCLPNRRRGSKRLRGPEQLEEITRRILSKFGERLRAQRCHEFRRVPHKGRFILLTTVRDRCQPRRIGFDQQPV